MNWNQILSTTRLGQEDRASLANEHQRTQFQRDYDRLIFSSPFRRMQNKTQVFPLPGSIFVHNRLTHSLEVASVGRSLGSMLADRLQKEDKIDNPLLPEIGSVVSAACLTHDMGNPPFGHSGEDAISQFFTNGSGKSLKSDLSKAEWKDFTLFDGNANAFRILSHQFNGRRPGGFALTYTMLASIVKYPFESVYASKPKFGFFQSEKENYYRIAEELGINRNPENQNKFIRHPLVLVEAADDICYQIMDLEDAHKLKILGFEETKNLFLKFYDPVEDKTIIESINKTLQAVDDKNEQIAYLRAGVIGLLAKNCVDIFIEKQEEIFSGSYQKSLTSLLSGQVKAAMDKIQEISIKRIYKAQPVIEIEISGYQIIGTLLEVFIDAVMNPKGGYSKRLLSLIPEQYQGTHENTYSKVQSVLDFVSGMTDLYALDLFRKIKGINLPGLG